MSKLAGAVAVTAGWGHPVLQLGLALVVLTGGGLLSRSPGQGPPPRGTHPALARYGALVPLSAALWPALRAAHHAPAALLAGG